MCFINSRNTFNRDLAASVACKNFDYERARKIAKFSFCLLSYISWRREILTDNTEWKRVKNCWLKNDLALYRVDVCARARARLCVLQTTNTSIDERTITIVRSIHRIACEFLASRSINFNRYWNTHPTIFAKDLNLAGNLVREVCHCRSFLTRKSFVFQRFFFQIESA